MQFLAQFSRNLIPSLYVLQGIFLISLYTGFKSITFFLIEDYFDLPPGNHVPILVWFLSYSKEYGHMASILLYGILGFLSTFILGQKLCAIPENKDYLKKRIYVLGAILVISFLSLTYDIMIISRKFLTGTVESNVLWQTCITIILFTGISCYAWLDLKRDFSIKSYFITIVTAVVCVSTVLGIAISIKMAPPAYIYKMRSDIERYSSVDLVLADFIKLYALVHHELPNSLNELKEESIAKEGNISDSLTKQHFNYKKIDEEKYQITIDFQTNFEHANRLDVLINRGGYYSHASGTYDHLKKGTNVLTYKVKKNPKGEIEQVIRLSGKVEVIYKNH